MIILIFASIPHSTHGKFHERYKLRALHSQAIMVLLSTAYASSFCEIIHTISFVKFSFLETPLCVLMCLVLAHHYIQRHYGCCSREAFAPRFTNSVIALKRANIPRYHFMGLNYCFSMSAKYSIRDYV